MFRFVVMHVVRKIARSATKCSLRDAGKLTVIIFAIDTSIYLFAALSGARLLAIFSDAKLARVTMLFEIIFASPAARLHGMIHVERKTHARLLSTAIKSTR